MEQLERRAEMESLDMSSTLFELYLILKLFLQQTDTVVQCAHNPYIVEFHQWFRGGIVYYLDVFAIKTISRVVTVLEEDDLRPATGAVPGPKCSSSTGEILEIISQIKIFWDQLAWPDKDEMKKFLKRSIGVSIGVCLIRFDYGYLLWFTKATSSNRKSISRTHHLGFSCRFLIRLFFKSFIFTSHMRDLC